MGRKRERDSNSVPSFCSARLDSPGTIDIGVPPMPTPIRPTLGIRFIKREVGRRNLTVSLLRHGVLAIWSSIPPAHFVSEQVC